MGLATGCNIDVLRQLFGRRIPLKRHIGILYGQVQTEVQKENMVHESPF